MTCHPVVSIVDKEYEHRSPEEHAYIVNFLEPYFSTLSPKMRKLISFYLRSVKGMQILTHKGTPFAM